MNIKITINGPRIAVWSLSIFDQGVEMYRNLALVILLLIINCHRPQIETHNFVIVGECKLPGYAKDVDVKGDYAYIANDQGGLQIVDISNPESPFIVGSYISQKSYQGVAVRDSFAYVAVAASDGGVAIFNVHNPDSIILLGQDPSFYAYRIIAPEGDSQYIYIAARYWFIVEDVTWPQYPSFIRRFATPGNVHSLFVVDSMVYLACEQMGLIIYNLNHPDSTAKIGEIDTPSNARDIFVWANKAYIADGYGGLVIIDVSEPDNLELLGSYDTPGYAQGIFVEDNLAYIADGSEGLKVFDISDSQSPQLYGMLKTPYAYNIYVRDKQIYLVDRDLGLVIIEEENR